MRYRSLFVVLISIGMLFSIFSCMKRSPVRIYDESNIAPAEAARISVPEDIEVLSVDGRRVKSVTDYILSTINEIHVAPGEREIVARFKTFWEHGKKKHEEIKSKEIILRFNAKRGGFYIITHPEINDIMEAKRFTENPDIWIAKVGKYFDKKNEGTRVSRTVEKSEAGRYAESEESAIIKGDASVVIPDKETETGKSAHDTLIEESSTMQEDTALKEEWDNLSNEEKEEFRKWLEWNSMSEEKKEKFREWTNSNRDQ
jgi:uncharacterized protein YccT (UPF0319 family)